MRSGHASMRLSLWVVALAASLVAGCAGQPSLSALLPAEAATTGPAHATTAASRWSLIVMRPVIGAPPDYAKQLVRLLNQRAVDHSVAILVDPDAKADVQLQGSLNLSKMKDKDGYVDLTYYWSITGANGAPIDKIEGTERVKLPIFAENPYAWVSPALTEAIATRIMTALEPHLKPSEFVSAGNLGPAKPE